MPLVHHGGSSSSAETELSWSVGAECGNKSCSAIYLDHNTGFELYPKSKKAYLGPQKPKRASKFGQNQSSELKGTKKLKVLHL